MGWIYWGYLQEHVWPPRQPQTPTYLMKPQASGAELHTAGKGAQQGVVEPQVRLQWPSHGVHGGNVNSPELGGSWSQLLWLKWWSLEFPEQSTTHHCFYKPGVTKARPHLAMGRVKWDGAGQGQHQGLTHSRHSTHAVLFLLLLPFLLPPLPLFLVESCSVWELSTSSWPLSKIEFLLL